MRVKITVTIPKKQLDSMRALVANGQTASVSSFVSHAIRISLKDAETWHKMLHDVLERTGGPLTDGEEAWIKSVLAAPK